MTKDLRNPGFTLLEVLIALAIIIPAFSGFFLVIRDSLTEIANSQFEANATEIAYTLINRIGADLPYASGIERGQDQGIYWEVRQSIVTSYSTAFEMDDIFITLRQNGHDKISLHTQKLIGR